MTPEAEPNGTAPRPATQAPAPHSLRQFGTSVQNYHKAQELHEYASQLTAAYNQASVRLAQHEDKICRMQQSFSWRCTAWLRALRRKFWDPFHPPAPAPVASHFVGCPVATGDFAIPSSPDLRFQILSGLNQIDTDNDIRLAGWVHAPAFPLLTQVRARVGEKFHPAQPIDGGHEPGIHFEIQLDLSDDARRIDLEIGDARSAWFLFHCIPLQKGRSFLATQSQPSMLSGLARYTEWVARHDTPTAASLNNLRHRTKELPRHPLLSLVMPVYNTDERWLRRAVESVLAQVYPRWELCIADDASTAPHIRPLLEKFAAQDPRIKVTFRSANGHISAASNSALELATGEFTAFLDHDDEITLHALFHFAELINRHPNAELIYSDEDKITETGTRFHPHFKPDWNPDLLRSQNYLCHLLACRTTTLRAIGGLRAEVEGAQDWDLALRLTERLKPEQIYHIPRILYHWRASEHSTALQLGSKDYVEAAARKTLEDHLARTGQKAAPELVNGRHWRLRRSVPEPAPLVTLIIPTRNRRELLTACIESIRAKTRYPNFEFLIADNESDDPELLAWYETQKIGGRFAVLQCPGSFNFSAINNRAAKAASGTVLGFLNNDLEALHPDWLDEMVAQALRPEIGAVGAKLYYPDLRIQHAGIITGLGGVAGHAFKKFLRTDAGTPQFRPHLVHNVSAVTAACLLVRKSVFEQAGGFDAENLAVAFNDVDLCLRIEALGYRNLFTPFAEFIHHESASRGSEYAPGKLTRFTKEIDTMKRRWGQRLLNDPAYNPNLTVETEDFALAFPPRRFDLQ